MGEDVEGAAVGMRDRVVRVRAATRAALRCFGAVLLLLFIVAVEVTAARILMS